MAPDLVPIIIVEAQILDVIFSLLFREMRVRKHHKSDLEIQ